MLSSPPASLAPERVYTFCSSALTDLWPTWMGARPREAYTRPPSPKHPYPVQYTLFSHTTRGRAHLPAIMN